MPTDNTPLQTSFDPETTRDELKDLLDKGEVPVRRIDVHLLEAVRLPQGTSIERPFMLDGDLLLLQPDGTILVIENATTGNFLLIWEGLPIPPARLLDLAMPESDWSNLADIPDIPAHFILNPGGSVPGSGDEVRVAPGDPLVGLPINLLLPPTEYLFPQEERRPYFGADGSVPPGWIHIRLKALPILVETDAPLGLTPSSVVFLGVGPSEDTSSIQTVRIELTGLPAGAVTSNGTLTAAGDGTQTLTFTGTYAEFVALALTFPTDFSTQSRTDFTPGPLGLTITVDTIYQDTATRSYPFYILAEGDARIDDTLPDTVSDETDAPVSLIPSALLLPEVTDQDGSETLVGLRLTVAGLPAGITAAELGLALPAGALASIITDPATGAATLTIDMTASAVGDVIAAYSALGLTLPADFSTANRNDLVTGTALPITLTLSIQTDEDFSAAIDGPNDGTVTTTRVVDIDFSPDIALSAPRLVRVAEDGGLPNSSVGVTADLGIVIDITDADGSETADPSDPRFAAVVEIVMAGLPAGATVNGGTLEPHPRGGIWRGTVAEAEALAVNLPGNFSGGILNLIRVTTPEGHMTIAQGLQVTPEPDIDIEGAVVVRETDAPLGVQVADYIDAVVTDPSEVLETLRFILPGLPPGTRAVDADGNAIGSFAGGTFTLDYDVATSGYDIRGARLIFPRDYSTTSPATTLEAKLDVTTDQGSVSGTAPLVILAEGDIRVPDATLALAETDAAVTFRLADSLLPRATDIDGSERVMLVLVHFNMLPPGTLVSLDGGSSFVDPGATLDFFGTLAEYRDIVVRLPRDFSTANPPTELFAEVGALTNEGGIGVGRLDITLDYELDLRLRAPDTVSGTEDGDGIDGLGVMVDLDIRVAATDRDGSEDATTVEIAFSTMPAGTVFSAGSFDAASGTWRGSMQNARDLTLQFPGDYSGTIEAQITAISPEGTRSRLQTIEIAPAGDIDFDVVPVILTETDAVIRFSPSDSWQVSVSDFDPNLPREEIDNVTLRLTGMPAGMVVSGVPASAITYDAAAGGVLRFTGTLDQYDAMVLTFPPDFSTQSRADGMGAITGKLSATSTEDPVGGSRKVNLTITPEGDVRIDQPAIAGLVETDTPLALIPSDLLLPVVTDRDGSEALETLKLVVAGLPSGITLAQLGVALPAGAAVSIANDPATGAATLTIEMDAGAVGDIAAAYAALTLTLPADFSTASRNDLVKGSSLPLTLTLDVQTDEDNSPAKDTPKDGTATATRVVEIGPEGDLKISGPGRLDLQENDIAGDTDLDGTTSAPVQFKMTDMVRGAASDADGSETVAAITVRISGLPDGARYSTDGGTSFSNVPSGPLFILPGLSPTDYANLVFRLPDDFSTTTDITGSVRFITDEAQMAGEKDTGPNDGVANVPFTVTVASEQDISITTADITVIEDYGKVIDLGLDAAITDSDGSEKISFIRVRFSGLPTGDTVLTDGTVLNGPNALWSGSLSNLRALGVQSFPEHFSGVVGITVRVATNEGLPTGRAQSMELNVTPVAEPTIRLSVDASPANVDRTGPNRFIVKEDTSLLLTIEAQTPDRDGSERLTQIVIENLPPGWVPAPGGVVDLALFEAGASDIASATLSGSTLTITLRPGVTVFNGALRTAPLPDDDRDVDTITGGNLRATVTSVDTAAGLPSDTATASNNVNVDVDAVLDPITLVTADATVTENTAGRRNVSVGITEVSLTDTDGSEALARLELTISVITASDVFDPSDPADLDLRVADSALRNFVTITQTGSTADSVSFSVVPAGGATDAQFADALEALRINVAQHFSGILTTDGTLSWNETRTGDAETDTSDNFATQDFQTVQTVRPDAEAELTASAFVLSPDEVAGGTPERIEAVAKDGAITADEILTLLESTADGSGPGQVTMYLGLIASTPDLDGSEELASLVIRNVPSDWIADHLSGSTVDRSAFATANGANPITNFQWNKIASATYDLGTGELTINFNADVTAFRASLMLQPTLYEDYDVDRQDSDPFRAEGDFFGADLVVELTSRDTNTVQTNQQTASGELDVDVDPVNNIAEILGPPTGNEQVIDDAGGVWHIPFEPVIEDRDGSETISSVVIRMVPAHLTIYVNDPADPTGPKIPALLTQVNTPPGFNTWSLEDGQWLTAEIHGVPTHFAGELLLVIDVLTTEADGGQERVTTLNKVFYVDPVVDGGNPTESGATNEDNAVKLVLDGNIIDNPNNSPESPEAILDALEISVISPDAQGRVPRFFDGAPIPDPSSPGNYLNEVLPNASGVLELFPAVARNLWILPAQDSNDDILLSVRTIYYETLDPSQATISTGTLTVTVTGIADTPIVTVQNADPTADPSSTISDGDINAIYRPTDVQDGTANADRVYGYAGTDTVPFLLDMRVSDAALVSGVIDPATMFTAADPLSGSMTEQMFGGSFDGSETLYYVITGVDPATFLLGASRLDASGTAYLVPARDLADVQFVPAGVSEVTYYDLKLNAIVIEDDQDMSLVTGATVQDRLNSIDSLPGGSVVSTGFTVVVLPDGGPGPSPCPPDHMLPAPTLELVGSGDEDTEIPFKIKITPVAGFYDSIDDLVNLPNGVVGDFTLAIDLPPGASLSSTVPGAVLYDPVNGNWVIDLGLLGVDPSDPTQTAESLLFTPPEHQSSPANPFDPADTFGPDDPYDDLDHLDYTSTLNNVSCKTVTTDSGAFAIVINPVVDGPDIVIAGPSGFDEDTEYTLDIQVNGIDGGERPVGDVLVTFDTATIDRVLDAGGTALTGTDIGGGQIQFSVPLADLPGLRVVPYPNYSGPMTVTVTATAEDIDGSTLDATVSRTLNVIPVADFPFFIPDTSIIDPDTGQPFVDLSGPTPVVTAIEDIPLVLNDYLEVGSPDMDGSETVTIVLSGVPDYLQVSGPSGSGFINNGDGSYTISVSAFPSVTLKLKDTHARLPDSLDPSLPSEIPLTLSVNTLELANSDQQTGSRNFIFRVRPDADTPTVTVAANPTTGVEDAPTPYVLDIAGSTLDPHETMVFEIAVPTDGQILVNGVVQPVIGGVVTLSGGIGATTGSGTVVFSPIGTVTFVPPADFGGTVTLDVTAIVTDADGIFTDTASSATAVDFDITPSGDLVLAVTDPDVDLAETDGPVSHAPAGAFSITVTDTDGSEVVDSVTYTINGVPDGTTYQIGAGAPVAASGTLTFTGSLADFNALTVTFPADFATNGTPLAGTIQVTTNESGSESGTFTIAVDGELDLTVDIDVLPATSAQTGAPLLIDFGIDAMITDSQATPSEWLEQLVIQFDQPLPAGTTASSGTISGDQLVLTRGSTSPAAFAALVAALSITLPGSFSGDLLGTVTVSTNHGTAPGENFAISVNDQPVVTGPVAVNSTDPMFEILFADLLINASDPDTPLTVQNIATADPDVSLTVLADRVQVAVPDGYVGTPVLTYDIADSGPGPAVTSTQANLDIDTLQMEADGTYTDPDGTTRARMDDVTGAVGGTDIAKGTAGDDAVVLDGTTPFAEIEGFSLLGGSDFIDLGGSSDGYSIDLGDGDDWAIGSGGADVLTGGAGADRLQGGGGADVFRLTDLADADSILDFDEPVLGVGVDQIDLTALVSLVGAETLASHVGYDDTTGQLSVDGSLAATVEASGGGFAAEVEVIFNNASGAQETAVI